MARQGDRRGAFGIPGKDTQGGGREKSAMLEDTMPERCQTENRAARRSPQEGYMSGSRPAKRILVSNNLGISEEGGLATWRFGSSPAIELFKAYQNIKAECCVSFIQDPRIGVSVE